MKHIFVAIVLVVLDAVCLYSSSPSKAQQGLTSGYGYGYGYGYVEVSCH